MAYGPTRNNSIRQAGSQVYRSIVWGCASLSQGRPKLNLAWGICFEVIRLLRAYLEVSRLLMFFQQAVVLS